MTPLYAGGRLGEWLSGSFAAVVGLAFARQARQRGQGHHVDVSMLECMAITMGGLGVARNAVLGEYARADTRTIEIPSIEPTADGYVGFCTITGQQFQDFLVLIERFDLLDDETLRTHAGRATRREEFGEAIKNWTTKRTTAEIVEAASALRIPVTPIGTPDTITEIDHFRERGVFVASPSGAFVQPRTPYRIDEFRGCPFKEAPAIGADDGVVDWSARAVGVARADKGLPLADLRIMDLTAFWAGPSATLVLAALGADVIKVEGVKRPDGMRYSGGRPPTTESWWETSSTFLTVNENKRALTLELTSEEGRDLARRLVQKCDVVIENFSPRVMPSFGLSFEQINATNPAAVVVRMPAFGLDGPWRDRVGFAQTMEQVSGMAWLTGPADGAPVIPRGPCDPLAGLHASFATLVALEQREHSGRGALVEATMVEAALNAAAQLVVEYSAYGHKLMRDGNRGPLCAPQGIYCCAGDDRWVALAVRDDAQWQALCRAIGEDGLSSRSEFATAVSRRNAHDEIDGIIEAWTLTRSPQEVASALAGVGVPSAAVATPGELVHNPQLEARHWLEPVDHPFVGRQAMPSMPFRICGRTEPWLYRASPTLGQHNEEILRELLGLSDEAQAALAEAQVIGTRPHGL